MGRRLRGANKETEEGLTMKKTLMTALVTAAISVTAAQAADLGRMVTKAPPPPPVVSPWDVAFGGAVMSDYMWRGISQSAHNASVTAYIEPRYNINSNLQLYVGVSGESIKFPNKAAAEIDFYGGIRPTFGPVAFDFGVWYYYYPGGESYYATDAGTISGAIDDASFIEGYGKVSWTINDYVVVGGQVWYTPSYLNTGADGTFYSGNVKFTAPSAWLPGGVGVYVSGEVGRQELGTADAYTASPTPFGALVVFAAPTDLPSYTTWNAGLGFTWKAFTLDLRYSDTDLSEQDCFLITGDPDGFASGRSNWCGSTFIAKLSVDTTLAALK
jgi:uncharacterized protein (TIGR02001 family)